MTVVQAPTTATRSGIERYLDALDAALLPLHEASTWKAHWHPITEAGTASQMCREKGARQLLDDAFALVVALHKDAIALREQIPDLPISFGEFEATKSLKTLEWLQSL